MCCEVIKIGCLLTLDVKAGLKFEARANSTLHYSKQAIRKMGQYLRTSDSRSLLPLSLNSLFIILSSASFK